MGKLQRQRLGAWAPRSGDPRCWQKEVESYTRSEGKVDGGGENSWQPWDSEPEGPGSKSAVLSAFPSRPLAAASPSVLISTRCPHGAGVGEGNKATCGSLLLSRLNVCSGLGE